MSAPAILAGWASAEITPAPPCWMGGYGARTSPAESTHDPLLANALALGDPAAPFVIVICDLVSVDDSLVAAIRERVAAGAPGATVWVGATHTHSGPDVGRLLAAHAPDPAVIARIVDGAAQAATDAIRGMRAVHARWATTSVTGIATDRDHPERQEEIALDLLCLYQDGAPSGNPAAVFGSFPCHPTVLSAENLAISADLPGAFRRHLGARLGGECWVALATGSAGNISTRHHRQGQGFPELERLGRVLAEQAEHAIGQARPLRLASPVVHSERIALQPKDLLDTAALAATADRLRQERAAALAAGNTAQARTLETALQGVQAAEHMRAVQRDVPADVPVATAQVGDLAVVAIPGELYNPLGTQLRHHASGPTMVLGYTNGYVGYLPTREAYQSLDYEVLMSPFAAGSSEKLVAGAEQLLSDTKVAGA